MKARRNMDTPPEELRKICAWCKAVLQEGSPGARISHGACKPCKDKVMEEAKRAAEEARKKKLKLNPHLPQSVPPEHPFLPALRPEPLPRGEWKPPQATFELAASGRFPLVYMPEGTYGKPGLTTAHAQLLTRTGLASPVAWYNLIAAAGVSANVFLIDRHGERWRLVDVLLDYGQETGQLVLRHVGSMSRGGDHVMDIRLVYGNAIPVVVYKRGGSLL